MILEPYDVPGRIIELLMFCYDNPDKKLPMRYIIMLEKILHLQLENHPAVTGDDIKTILFIETPKKYKQLQEIMAKYDKAEKEYQSQLSTFALRNNDKDQKKRPGLSNPYKTRQL